MYTVLYVFQNVSFKIHFRCVKSYTNNNKIASTSETLKKIPIQLMCADSRWHPPKIISLLSWMSINLCTSLCFYSYISSKNSSVYSMCFKTLYIGNLKLSVVAHYLQSKHLGNRKRGEQEFKATLGFHSKFEVTLVFVTL